MDEMTAEDLRDHLKQLEETDREQRDELLTELLVHVYPTKRTQDS